MYENIGQAKMAVAGLQGGLINSQTATQRLPEIKRINSELENEIASMRLTWEALVNRLGDVIETFPSSPKDNQTPTTSANSAIGSVMTEHVLKVREVREQMTLVLDRLAI